MWILSYSDGTNSLKDISILSNIEMNILNDAAQLLLEKKLIKIFE